MQLEIQPGGSPTIGSALLRIILAIPSAFVLGLLGIVSGIIWIIAAIIVLIQESYPAGMFDFQCAVLRWQARLIGYQTSLVEPYPPFAVDTGPEETAAASEAGQAQGNGNNDLTRPPSVCAESNASRSP